MVENHAVKRFIYLRGCSSNAMVKALHRKTPGHGSESNIRLDFWDVLVGESPLGHMSNVWLAPRLNNSNQFISQRENGLFITFALITLW